MGSWLLGSKKTKKQVFEDWNKAAVVVVVKDKWCLRDRERERVADFSYKTALLNTQPDWERKRQSEDLMV